MRLTKIYTRVGDQGSTLLATGERVPKDAPRIEAYGTIDELNASMGCLCDWLKDSQIPEIVSLAERIQRIQNELFDLGGELSLPEFQKLGIKLTVVEQVDVDRLEQEMDQMNTVLPALENFVLPGGVPGNSYAHLARTICRRAERRIVSLSHIESVRPEIIRYVNRLSDWLFVLSRHISHLSGAPEVLWNQRKQKDSKATGLD